eukprot:jgi/Chlat1/2943/Chrsp2S04681
MDASDVRRREIALLRAEVDEMRARLAEAQAEQPAKPSLEAMDGQLLVMSDRTFEEDTQRDAQSQQPQSDAEKLFRRKILAQAAFTRLEITLARSWPLPPSNHDREDASSLQQTEVCGRSCGLPFRLCITVEHSEGSAEGESAAGAIADSRASVVKLEVDVTAPPRVQEELRPLLEGVRSNRSLRAFFRGFASYTRFVWLRSHTFRHLLTSWSSWDFRPSTSTGIARTTVLEMENADTGVALCLSWALDCSAEGFVKQRVELLPGQYPQDAAVPFQSLATRFQDMCLIGSVQAAVDAVLDALTDDTLDGSAVDRKRLKGRPARESIAIDA